MTTLYTVSNKKLRVWQCYTDDSEVVVVHGELGGKQVEKRYTAKPKNIGRANETTPEQQAALECEAKIVKQLKSGYFRNIEDAENHKPFQPMKAQDFKKHGHKLKFPAIFQAKLNGQRLMVDAQGDAWSKQGESLELPKHWEGVNELAVKSLGLDGEVYAGLVSEGGLSLQDIISAFRKENENTHKLQYWVYDIPVEGVTMRDRHDYLHALSTMVFETGNSNVRVMPGIIVHNMEEADALYEAVVKQGYEGCVYRNMDGLYEHDKRSYDMLKRKPRADGEAKALSYELDRNGEPVYTVEALNGEQVGVEFKLKMKKPLRGLESVSTVLEGCIRYEYEELSDAGVPLKACGIEIREMVQGEGRW